MGVDIAVGMFIDDKDFVPTKQQLLGVAAILQEVGIVDAKVCQELRNEIESFYIDSDDPIMVQGKDCDRLGYIISGPNGFPFFESSFFRAKRHLTEDDLINIEEETDIPFAGEDEIAKAREEEGFSTQSLQIYKEEHCMQPQNGERFTRFVIGHLDVDRRGPWVVEVNRKIKSDPVLVELQSRLEELLDVEIISEVLFY
jgi:hypothetical protein